MSTIRRLAKVLKVKPEDLTEPPRGRVVNVKSGEPYHVYIGNQMPWEPYRLKKSVWANPYNGAFRSGEITREEVLSKYREHVLSNPQLLDKLPELEGKVLACWCAPEPCHGDVLLELAWQAAEGRIEKIGS
jgi:hypothetical protein